MKIISFPVPNGVKQSADYQVRVCPVDAAAYTEVGVYTAKVAQNTYGVDFDHCDMRNYAVEEMSFCSFYSDFETPLVVEVTNLTGYGDNLDIRPIKVSVPFSYENNLVRFFVDKPQKFSLEFDGDFSHNLFIFIENMPKNEVRPEDDKCLYFPAGVHDAGEINLESGQTVYLAGGAYVYGRIYATNADNITVCGPGILSGEKFSHERGGAGRGCLLKFENCNNVTVKDCILLDSPAWTLVTIGSKGINVDNLKQISYFDNSDGFDVVGCENMTVTDSFLRVFDDCVSLKSWGKNNRNITFKRCIFWNDAAHAMLIGPESSYGMDCIFENILFEDITVLFTQETNPTFMGCMALMCADSAIFRNIVFRNIEIERLGFGKLFSIKYSKAYATDYGKSIENVLFDNVHYYGVNPLKSTVNGIDGEHTVKNVKLRNFFFNGRPLREGNNQVEVNGFAEVSYEETASD